MTSKAPDDSTHRQRTPAVTAEGEAFPSDPKRLRYVSVAAPASGKSIEIAPGVRWARIPLPIDLNHINVWLIDAGDGCIIVDTGMAVSMGKDAWESIAEQVFATNPLRGVFVTHVHPDHIGLAAWLQERHGVPVMMSKRTYETASLMMGGDANKAFSGAETFFRENGLTEIEHMLPMFKPERFIRMASGLPHVELFVADNDVLQWSAPWIAMETNGHAEGHLCLSNPGASVLISGDQVLPTISSNISFTFRSNDLNPLGSYLSSLERLRQLPTETLVLPSHGMPFYGLQHRIDDLIAHHQDQLAMVTRVCAAPTTAAELLPLMFRRELKGIHLFLALGEALAHLEYLVHARLIERQTTRGVVRYSARSG